jgi:5,6-dimethylbenzimidazole synthase
MSGDGRFSEVERDAVYRAIFERRDVRRDFLPAPIPDVVLTRVLTAAHHAGSVGFMQPWDFVVVRDPAVKGLVKDLFRTANAEAATKYRGKRAALYRSLKLEGIEEAPVNIGVTCSRQRGGPNVLAVRRCAIRISIAPVAPFRTSGWPHVQKASGLAGSASWTMEP